MRHHNILICVCASLSMGTTANLSPIPNTQDLQGPEFEGRPASLSPLNPKVEFDPLTSQTHCDGGNSGSVDFTGPLGVDTQIISSSQLVPTMLWNSDGSLTGAKAPSGDLFSSVGLAAYDPNTLEVLAEWSPTGNETLNVGYVQMRLEDMSILVPATGGRIFVVQRQNFDNGTILLTTLRRIDVQEYLDGEALFNTQFDARGNIWFTAGSYIGDGHSFTVGIVTLDGVVFTHNIPNQSVRNGIAVNGTDMYVISGPSPNAPTEEPGYMWKFTVGENNDSIDVVWKAPYDAGSTTIVRGSGTTPALMGNGFVAAVDNAEGQANLLIYHQEAQESSGDQLYCSVPLFTNNGSSADVRPTVHFDGNAFTVAIQNTFGGPPVQQTPTLDEGINDSWNNMTVMPGGITQISVDSEGCHITWENEVRIKSVPVLSTSTGILYGYTQDVDLTMQGLWVWYFVAIDWRSGEVLWRRRAGAGGSYNDNWFGAFMAPNGKFYQATTVGTVWIEDGA